jgi:hypothetical protein
LDGETVKFYGLEYMISSKTGLAYEFRSSSDDRGALELGSTFALVGLCNPKKPESGEP